jgi:hypothetical protein
MTHKKGCSGSLGWQGCGTSSKPHPFCPPSSHMPSASNALPILMSSPSQSIPSEFRRVRCLSARVLDTSRRRCILRIDLPMCAETWVFQRPLGGKTKLSPAGLKARTASGKSFGVEDERGIWRPSPCWKDGEETQHAQTRIFSHLLSAEWARTPLR